MTVVIAAVVVLLVLTMALAAGRHRRQRPAPDDTPNAVTASELSLPPDEVVLVPFPNATGQALLVGSDDALAVFDRSGLTRASSPGNAGPLPQLVRRAMSVGGFGATQHAQRGVDSGRIVALSKETMEHLEKGKPVVDKADNMLGVIRGEKGRISHVMRLDRDGAKVVMASNAATLAVTAALGQQLEAIAEQLEEISETLDSMVRDQDRKRLSDAVAYNEVLLEVSSNVQRRGITEADVMQLAAIRHGVSSLQTEVSMKLEEVITEEADSMNRHDRHERLEKLMERERLEVWLALQVQADLARTRSDLLNLLWEHQKHPESASELNQRVAEAIAARQRRAARVGRALRELANPASKTFTDPARLISRYQLGRAHTRVTQILAAHGEAFAGPEQDANTIPTELLGDGGDRREIQRIEAVLELEAPAEST